ncbi:MAG TPA: hypothetical protein VMC61_04900, partial [Methanocella sp.]|nr:hypothetical protein [Methanocella sp.]
MQEYSEDDTRPFFYRFWARSPPKGDVSVFSSSWYGLMLDGFGEDDDKKLFARRLDEAAGFEKAMTDSGYLIIKLFLHISKEEQRTRQNKLEKDPVRSFLLTKSDKEQNKKYGKYLKAIESMVDATDTPNAPWTIVEAESKRFATIKVIKAVIQALETRLNSPVATAAPVKSNGPIPQALQGVDLSKSFPSEDYKARLDELQDKLRRLQFMAYHGGVPVAIVFEGWDAAGKSGGIKRITEPMDPRGYQVFPTSAPNDVEIAHHYLWRFWRDVPARGRISIFDRSWYGRVLVERVEGLTPPADWKRAYDEINEMEKEWAENGTILVKFWLHIGLDEQLKRFEAREFNPFKSYKITGEDWRNRDKWNKYVAAANEMFARTNT